MKTVAKSPDHAFVVWGIGRLVKTWDESRHPRDRGKFSVVEGSGKEMKLKGGKPLPEHVKEYRLPPAWTDVVVSTDPKSALVAQGTDAKGRRQSVYSKSHTAAAAAVKFARTNELRGKLASIQKQNEGFLNDPDPKRRDAAAVTALIIHTGIRPGSNADTGADKKAYGATTLRGDHVVVNGDNVTLKFTGKKGVALSIPVIDPAVKKDLIRRKAKVGSRPLFSVSDSNLRDHIAELDGGKFHPKDFRTAKGTNTAVAEIKKMKPPKDEKSYKQAVKTVAVKVSSVLGNTPTIALQSYIDPSVFSHWRHVI